MQALQAVEALQGVAKELRVHADDRYLPNDSVLNRFLFVVRFFANNGFYVCIDNHLNMDSTAVDNPTLWAQYWGQLATSIQSDPATASYVLYEILNEPDSKDLRWEAANGLPGAGDLALAGMDAITAVVPGAVLLVEGAGQVGQAISWGKLLRLVWILNCRNMADFVFS